MYSHNEIDHWLDFLIAENRKAQRNIGAALDYLSSKDDDFRRLLEDCLDEENERNAAEVSVYEI